MKYFIRHEFIGKSVEVIKSKNKHQIGIKGRVINETKKMMKIETKNGEKIISKKGTVFRFRLPRIVDINGDLIIVRPEDRIRKKFKKWDL